jgi:hypothetical protein
MISISALELANFAEKNGWVLTEKSDADDLKFNDDYLVYLTPQGREVVVGFWEDGSIQKIHVH